MLLSLQPVQPPGELLSQQVVELEGNSISVNREVILEVWQEAGLEDSARNMPHHWWVQLHPIIIGSAINLRHFLIVLSPLFP